MVNNSRIKHVNDTIREILLIGLKRLLLYLKDNLRIDLKDLSVY